MMTDAAALAKIEALLLSLGGTSAQLGTQINTIDGKRFYHVSIRLANNDLAYGDGVTLSQAYDRALSDAPIRPRGVDVQRELAA